MCPRTTLVQVPVQLGPIPSNKEVGTHSHVMLFFKQTQPLFKALGVTELGLGTAALSP